MTTTMVRSVMLTVLMHIFLVSHGVQCFQPEEGVSLHPGALDLPWQDELCCDSSSAHLTVEGDNTHAAETNRSVTNLPHYPLCSFRSSTTELHPPEPSVGTCLDIMCRIDENWEHLTCVLQSHGPPSTTLNPGLMTVNLQRLLYQQDDTEVKDGNTTSDNPVVCKAEDSFMCSAALDTRTSFVTVVTVSISDAIAPPVLLRIPARPVKPSPPVNLLHIQTIEAELILHWDDPSDFDTGPLRYEVRHSSNTTHLAWQVLSALEEPRLSLELKPLVNYIFQVRCSGLDKPPVWSEWSAPHYINLDTVSYIPKKLVARPGENVTVYCVFNDHSINASTAVWMLNLQQPLHRSQYHPVNQWVSQITVRSSETRMYDLLQCTQRSKIPYSLIYIEGASININCETNGDIDAMECSWNIKQLTDPKFRSSWSDLSCDVMEERERAGEKVGEMGPECVLFNTRKKTCTIQPLRMNCYKLWLEVTSHLGPIRSKPIYLSPLDHVKPHSPTNVKAVSQSRGVVMVTWDPPFLPIKGVKCQLRYQLPSAVRAQPEWKVQSPVPVAWAEVSVSDMCRVYVVQVRCMPTNAIGYWSEWSDSVYSTPQNSRVPEGGPDFWRTLQDDPYRNQTNVTLLFQPLQISGHSYCVDGFIVQYQALSGSVVREEIELVSSYSFEWNQVLQTVTVEAYNNLGSSTNNINMTLERQPKRRCVLSFSVSVINSTCVSLSWSLLDNTLVPLFMVVQWSPHRQQDSALHKGRSRETWARLRYTNRPIYLRGDFLDSEESGFHLYPVFADGEGEPMYATATRGDPQSYMMLSIITFLSIVLLVTLILSQNQMKKFVLKDVPNPNKCSWARGLDFKKADTFHHLFRPPEGLSAWPPLLPSENISKVVILDKIELLALTTALVQAPLVSLTPDAATAFSISLPLGFDSEVDPAQPMESEVLLGGASLALNLVRPQDALTSSSPGIDQLLLVDPPVDQPPGSNESSAQSLVTYATVLPSDLKQEQQPIHLHYKDGSGSSSSDEGNFSANNSDISGSFLGGLWELDTCRGGEMDDPRHSCSYNSVEELSETSEPEDEGEEEVRDEKDLYYLGMDFKAQDEETEEQREEDTNNELLKNVVSNREDCSVELHPLLGPEDSSELLSVSTCGFLPVYMPQFRTSLCMSQLAAQPQDGKPQP
ncbi:LOW QUALITY PROTEIN: leptin receptor [Cottoperca gobio]|uniref:LOW QUALITY PROTEIN: leptin receptor n=1 Tax=Cottoperca gobio TaxID=56716 RepID=A0A6J2PIM7_COTGO|nr:LOW QUALITY PROTEIN: leptin receptor [Cottoperca gobio]